VEKALAGKRPSSLRRRPRTMQWEEGSPRAPLSPAHYAYLKVSEGCLKGCSFCVIPKIKGPLVSRPIESLIAEARALVQERGVKELIVVGQDTSDYGIDIYGHPRIADLLSALAKIDGLGWIRLLYCHPHGISRQIIDVIRDEPRICKYLDMAIEHADDKVLARMNRLSTQSQLRERVAQLRSEISGIALRTSVVVGFPGETEEAFETLLAFLQEIQFERLGAFTYSREEGSASYQFADQVPASVARKRHDRLMKAQQEIASSVSGRAVGKTLDVVIDEADSEDASQFIGRSAADCPDVDGVVFVKSEKKLAAGTWIKARITDSYEYDLVGECCSA
jgi:ribosomal protein S12 methylthiotransferase